jgi:hypothetical protein
MMVFGSPIDIPASKFSEQHIRGFWWRESPFLAGLSLTGYQPDRLRGVQNRPST